MRDIHSSVHAFTLTGWVSLDGCKPLPYKNENMKAVVTGPLCRSAGDLIVFLESVVPTAAGLAAKVAETDIRTLKIWLAKYITRSQGSSKKAGRFKTNVLMDTGKFQTHIVFSARSLYSRMLLVKFIIIAVL